MASPALRAAKASALLSDRSTRAEAFLRAHSFVDASDDALHAAAVFTTEYYERLELREWSCFPVEAFVGVHLPGELYGFDALRAGAIRALPFFFLWLARTGELSAVEAAALAKRAKEVHAGAYHVTHPRPRQLPRGIGAGSASGTRS